MKKSIKKLTTKAIDNTKAVKGGNGREVRRKSGDRGRRRK